MISRAGKSLATSDAAWGGDRRVGAASSVPPAPLMVVSPDKFNSMRQRGHSPSGAPGGNCAPHWPHLADVLFFVSITGLHKAHPGGRGPYSQTGWDLPAPERDGVFESFAERLQ